MSALAPILQGFFTDKLLKQRQASPNTIAAYRDTCRLLLGFATRATGVTPCELDIGDLNAALITAFLTHLETDRDNAVTTRNARLAAIRSLFGYAALRAPEHADSIARVLAIPPKRCDRAVVCFLTAAEIDALLAAPDRTTGLGRRDHALLLLACQTGLRVSELTGLTRGDVHLGAGAHVGCHGKGRKDRATPLSSKPLPHCGFGWPNTTAEQTTHCLRPAAAARYHATRSPSWSPNTPHTRHTPAPASQPKTSPRTPCDTRRPWRCCRPEWTPR
jgi:integrase/recombinase XerD